MALQLSGAISFSDLQTEFGGSPPISLSEYYRDAGFVGAGAPNVPTSGALRMNNFFGGQAAIAITLASNASNQDILTLAQAQGYNASTDSTPIIVNINSGVTISGSGTHALTTGGLNANSDLTINISGNVDGYTGSNGSTPNGAGGNGGDALYVNTLTGGSGAIVVNVLSGGNLRGGGGGGGGGGQRGQVRFYDDKSLSCFPQWYYGSYGSTGSAGGYGQNGSSGGSGTWPYEVPAAYRRAQCIATYPSGGASGGVAGFALRMNGRTVTLNNSGTVNGSAS